MHERLSFYVHRDSPLHRLNPLTKLTLSLGLILIAFISPWYWTPQLIIPIVILPLIFLARVPREYSNAALRIILPSAGFLFTMQALFQPGGDTVLTKIWVLTITQEAVMTAFTNATRIFVMVSSFTLFLLTTHPNELMSDLTRRGLPSQFAYVIISTLQILPQMQSKAQTIISAQRSRGLDTQSTFAKRVGALVPLIGPLVFGSLVEVEERAIAIEARGFTSTRTKTFLKELPDSSFDQALRWVILALIITSLGLKIWLS
jgi:energy-coupling factor transport system permease protein